MTPLPELPAVHALAEAVERRAPLESELQAADRALGELQEVFGKAVAWQSFSAEEAALAGRVERAFRELREILLRLGAGSAAEGDAVALTAAAGNLEASLAGLREAGARRPGLSRVPAVHFLLLAGRRVLEDGAPWALLEGCLEDLLPSWEGLGALPPELQAHDQALADLVEVVRRQDSDALAAALEAVRVTGEALPGAPPPEAAQFLCPRCGGTVGEWDRSCPSCGGRLPERLEEPPAHDAPEAELPDYVAELFAAAETLRTEHGDWDRFEASVSELRRRAVQCLGMLERLPRPGRNVPQDEWETWNASQECIENGLDLFFQALDDLESLALNPDPHVLDRGLESVLEAVRETRQVGVHMQRLLV